MARYNAWQNEGLLDLVPRLPEEELRRDRGAFFGGILGTLSHLLWADRMWLSRLAGHPRPAVGLSASATLVTDAVTWAEGRRAADAALLAWAEDLGPGDLDGDLTWVSGVTGGEVSRPLGLIASHVFNHQTHHRGQVHALLTAAGLRPRDTDLFLMPL
ncbi:damage-inducible protein DinB [Rubellimicrobium roseum]|uniref:Damage-inducible protein DinB n=2 Tax=Rubellimicrobium roseum TaxID=687525 RepID=A0A5C4NG69_9RHOB|nr:damage-inducible protein DinB [Rubellimicrobium roseum]